VVYVLATNTLTVTPTPPPTCNNTPVATTVQTLWRNGVASPLWGQTLTLYNSGTTAITDNLTGDGTVLEFIAPISSVGYNDGISLDFSTFCGIDASGYYASGHFQCDLMLGPAAVSTTGWNLNFNLNGKSGFDQLSGAPAVNNSSFTHISLPFPVPTPNSCSPNCYNFIDLESIQIDTAVPAAGVVFYINNIQITPN